MKHSIRRLPDAELEVMQALWGCEVPAARAAIEQHLPASHPMALTTLLTLLTRLSDKGFVAIQKDGRKSLYTPLVSREDYLASQSRSFVENICGGSISAFASALCSSGLSKEDLAELRALLERSEL